MVKIKKKLLILSILVFLSLLNISNTGAWLVTQPPGSISEVQMGTVEVQVVQEGHQIKVKNVGTSQALVRVRLIPQWSDENLSTSNMDLRINLSDWEFREGYYYYKEILGPNYLTCILVDDIQFIDLTEEYRGLSLNLKILAEGIQITAEELWNP